MFVILMKSKAYSKPRAQDAAADSGATWSIINGLSINFDGRHHHSPLQEGAAVESISNSRRGIRRQDEDAIEVRRRMKELEEDDSKYTQEARQPETKQADWRILSFRGSKEQKEPRMGGAPVGRPQRVGSYSSSGRTNLNLGEQPEHTTRVSGSRQENLKQRQAVYRAFGGSPVDCIRVEQETDPILPSAPDHVVVKILVS